MRRRDEAAFEAFVGARGRALLRTAHLLVGDLGLAEDLLQSTLERVARQWHRLDGDAEGYARRVLANLAVDGWRRRGARPVERLGTVSEGLVPERVTPGAGDRVDTRRDLIAALLTLTPRQRTVLVLRYFEDLSEAETAATLGIAVGTVKSTAARALAQLRTHQHLTTGSIG